MVGYMVINSEETENQSADGKIIGPKTNNKIERSKVQRCNGYFEL